MNDFLDLADLSAPSVRELLALATRLEHKPEPEALAGRVLGLVFMNPSLRTLASFQAGMARLGGSSFVISPGSSWKLEFRAGVPMTGDAAEHIREAIPVLATYADALGVRAFAGGRNLEEDLGEPVLAAIRGLVPAPLINMESAVNHPCQALADWKTMDDEEIPSHGGRFVLSWADHPKALPLAVPAAAAHMAAMRGMDVTVLRPEGFARGSTSAYGDPGEDARLRTALSGWTVDEDWFGPADPDCIFMHCLPVRREVVVTSDVLEGPRSRVVRQARNRMYGQMAVLYRLLAHQGEQQ
jgi:N-acetylornithine carbamoyltransferase